MNQVSTKGTHSLLYAARGRSVVEKRSPVRCQWRMPSDLVSKAEHSSCQPKDSMGFSKQDFSHSARLGDLAFLKIK